MNHLVVIDHAGPIDIYFVKLELEPCDVLDGHCAVTSSPCLGSEMVVHVSGESGVGWGFGEAR